MAQVLEACGCFEDTSGLSILFSLGQYHSLSDHLTERQDLVVWLRQLMPAKGVRWEFQTPPGRLISDFKYHSSRSYLEFGEVDPTLVFVQFLKQVRHFPPFSSLHFLFPQF